MQDLRGGVGGPFSFVARRGESLGIIGPSGIGKTRLLRMVADLEPSTGSVRLGTSMRETMTAPAWRRAVTWVAAEPGWWADTALEHFSVSPTVEQLESFGLSSTLLGAPVIELSTGERQRFGLLRAIVQRPAVLLLDEPTSALDDAATALVEGVLRAQMQNGTALVLVSHRSEQVARLADRVLRMTKEGVS